MAELLFCAVPFANEALPMLPVNGDCGECVMAGSGTNPCVLDLAYIMPSAGSPNAAGLNFPPCTEEFCTQFPCEHYEQP